jgi:uncharacterized protein YecT (DUF1311 family)
VSNGKAERFMMLVLALALSAWPAAADEGDTPSGTWGLPPIDGKPGLTGSYFSLYRDERGGFRAHLSLNPSGWSCGADVDVTWNAGASRFEWPNRSKTHAAEACWLAASPVKDQLDLRVWCPYECTAGETTHQITLEHIAADRLLPPDHVVDTFCSSHEAMRQELCRPGDLQRLVAEGNHAARQRGVLADGDGDVPFLPETDRELLAILDQCRPAGNGRTCLTQALRTRRDTAAEAVAARQKALAEERGQSEAAAATLTAAEAQAWEGTRHLVNDEMIGALTLDSCDAKGCTLALEGETNYSFGYQGRRGSCSLRDNRLTFTGDDRGFSYVEPAEAGRNADGAGPFANFCRIDVARTADGIRLALRGAGCADGCLEAPFTGLVGSYHARPQPSFTCPPETGELAWDEENLCLDPELARLDREMAAVFGKARAAAQGAAQRSLVRAQRAWIAARGTECDADKRRTCLVEMYRKRLRELEGSR